MTAPIQTSSVRLPDNTNAGAIADFGASRVLGVNFSGQDVGKQPSAFTLFGSVRVHRAHGADVQIVFDVEGQFRVTVDRSGTVTAGFVPQGAANGVSAHGALVEGRWHELIVSFEPDRHDTGTLSVQIDSGKVAERNVSTVGTSLRGGNCALGVNADRIEFGEWAMWSEGYDQKAGLGANQATQVGVWDFSVGPQGSIGGQVTPTVAHQVWHVPALAMTGNSYVVPNEKGLNPGDGPFTVMGWVYVPDPIPSVTYPLVSNFESGVSRLQVHVAPNDSGALFVAYLYGTPGNQAWSYGQIHHRWTHVTLTFDGSSTQLYTDGNRVGGPVAGKFPPIGAPTLSFGTDPAADQIWAGTAGTGAAPTSRVPADNTWYLQALSVWTRALVEDEIRKWMDPKALPWQLSDCAAFFPFVDSMDNMVSRQPVTPVGDVSLGTSVVPLAALNR